MITVMRTNNHESIKIILANPILFNCTYGQDEEELTEDKIASKEWLLIKENDEILGCFEIQSISKVTIEAHIFVLPHYWKKSKEIVEAGHKWAKEHHYKVIFSRVPGNCVHMLKFMERINYQVCGQIENGIIYKGQLVPLFLYSYQL